MIRTFVTNEIRRSEELSGSDWTFCARCEGAKPQPVCVPSCWETYPGYEAYRGEALYSRCFEAGGNVRLLFKGVSHTARVYLDGRLLGSHYNAYTGFDFIVEGLEPGSHTLELVADNRFSEQSALHVPNDYMSYGGISRGVVLERLGDVLIEYVHATPVQTEAGWKLKLSAAVRSLSDEDRELSLDFTLRQGAAKGQGAPVTARTQRLRLPARGLETLETWLEAGEVQTWDIENPRLYYLSTVLSEDGRALDDLIERVGFRTISVSGKDILLNGRKLRIKGLCRHEDHPMFGCALPLAAMQQDLQFFRELGANAVRTVHYPNDELFLDLCDEQGFAVWEENHARGLSLEQMENPNFEPQAEAVIREMIRDHFNHPSIIIWGILNECASETAYGYECYRRQYALIRSLDDSRPCTSASCKFKTDICFGLPDIVSYNLYPEWYHDTPAGEYVPDIYDWVQRESEGSGKPFIVSEIGAGAIYGYRTPTHCKWSEEYQAKALDSQMEAVFGQAGCSGIFIWQFCDVRISEEWFATRPRTMNNKGVVDEFRRRKLAYETVRTKFHALDNYFE